jgi:3'(2'), 5'-bisphosphate nucleotidase
VNAGENDHRLAARLAAEAGELLLSTRAGLEQRGAAYWEVGDAGDVTAHRFLVRALGDARPHDAVLSEEGRDDRRRLSADRVWIVDPLDGTNEYSDGRSDWAVHVALWERGALVAGAVAIPAIARTFATEPLPAVALPRKDAPPRVIISRTRATNAAVIIANALGAEIVRLGSAGVKAMAVLMGEADIYAHSGGMYEWDTAAPVAVATAAGLHVSRIDGSPLEYNKSDAWSPDLLICRPEFAGPALEALWGDRRGYPDGA